MLDIDGTLCEIVECVDDAVIPSSARQALEVLARGARAGVYLAFVTGRSITDARRMVGLEGVVIYGNHGMERLDASGTIHGPEGWEEMGRNLRSAAREIVRVLATMRGSTLEDKRLTLSVHYRGMDMNALPELQHSVSEIARRYSLRMSPGKCVINLAPSAATGKGAAALEFVRDIAARNDVETPSILFAGDDITDEDAFEALSRFPQAVTVRVGDADADSAARYAMDSPGDVHQLIASIAAGLS